MNKLLTILVVLLVAANTLTDKEILQQGLNGLFEANKLADPTTMVACFDDPTAHSLVQFIGDSLKEASSGSIADLVSLITTLQQFLDSVPEPVVICLKANEEAKTVAALYGITNTTNINALITKVVTYVTFHYLQVHKWLGSLNDLWTSEKYYQAGKDVGGYLHSMLGAFKTIPNATDKETIQLLLNGLFESNKLADPTTIVPCIDDATAHSIVVFIGQFLEKAAKGSISDITALKQLVEDFGKSIPQAVKKCLDGNAEFTALGVAFGITPETSSSAIEKKVITYVTLHYLDVHKKLGDINSNWQAGKPFDTGKGLSELGHKALGSSESISDPTDKEILQQGLNGFFEANSLADPTTIVSCLSDSTAHNLVVFVGETLKKASSGSISDLINLIPTIEKFLDSIPESEKKCLDNNKEAEALGLKYGITNATDPNTIIKKFVTYATLHYLQVHKWLGAENDLWTAGKYYQTGYDGANYLHSILGGFQAIPNATDKETIQLLLNGLFESNKLADPTTIVPCIDDATAHSIVVFIGQFLEKAAKGSISDISALKQLVEDFGKSIPEAVKKCLDGNAEFTALGKAFGITPDTSSSTIEKKVIAYVTLHYLDVHKKLGGINDSWKAGKAFDTGKGLSELGHKALGSSESIPNSTDKETIQLLLNGLFESNKLPNPTTIVPCIDDTTAHSIVVFIGQFLEKAAKGSISDISALKQLVEDFGKSIPEAVKKCLDGNAELTSLSKAFGITPETSSSAIEKKVIAYVTLHYLDVHKRLGGINDNWKAGKPFETGKGLSELGHKALGSSNPTPNLTDKQILQQVMNGVTQQNSLPDTTTVLPCIDDSFANKTVVFMGLVLAKAAQGSLSDVEDIASMVDDFNKQVPESAKTCLKGNQEILTVAAKYGITPDTDMLIIQAKVLAFVTFHYLDFHKELGLLNSEWVAGNYEQMGYDGAAYWHKVLQISIEDITLLRSQR